MRVHNGRVGRYGPPEDIVRVRKVNDYDLVLLVDLLAHTDEVVRLECQRLQTSGISACRPAQSMTRRSTENEIDAGCTPTLDSWRCSQNEMGFWASMVFEDLG